MQASTHRHAPLQCASGRGEHEGGERLGRHHQTGASVRMRYDRELPLKDPPYWVFPAEGIRRLKPLLISRNATYATCIRWVPRFRSLDKKPSQHGPPARMRGLAHIEHVFGITTPANEGSDRVTIVTIKLGEVPPKTFRLGRAPVPSVSARSERENRPGLMFGPSPRLDDARGRPCEVMKNKRDVLHEFGLALPALWRLRRDPRKTQGYGLTAQKTYPYHRAVLTGKGEGSMANSEKRRRRNAGGGLSIPAAAEELNASEWQLRRAVDRGEVAVVQFGGLRRIPPAEIERLRRELFVN